eukprot:8688715-Pyramimonas_sp.AAC.2
MAACRAASSAAARRVRLRLRRRRLGGIALAGTVIASTATWARRAASAFASPAAFGRSMVDARTCST